MFLGVRERSEVCHKLKGTAYPLGIGPATEAKAKKVWPDALISRAAEGQPLLQGPFLIPSML